jgi:Ca2+-binding EF-hand superfamily protein
MKQLLRKLDPYLDDYDIHQIYKAIDSDGGGSVSFIEFVESHVLRAKILFDRYDSDKSRTLSQFKFRELMLDMDESLTSSQMEAIYTLVADHNTGKVHLGGFLNPNIVKLKLLFDKYDQDGSRYLDYTEFNKMLKELFRNTPERDIDVLQAELCPPGTDQGITFTDYIQRFKEIQRHHDLMQLAKRRLARERALAKGLIYREAD